MAICKHRKNCSIYKILDDIAEKHPTIEMVNTSQFQEAMMGLRKDYTKTAYSVALAAESIKSQLYVFYCLKDEPDCELYRRLNEMEESREEASKTKSKYNIWDIGRKLIMR